MSENKWLPFFLAGVGVGALAGVLLAPQSGKETREKIGDWIKEKRRESEETLSELREKVSIQKENLTAAITAGREASKHNEVKALRS